MKTKKQLACGCRRYDENSMCINQEHLKQSQLNYARVGQCPVHQCMNCSEVFDSKEAIKAEQERIREGIEKLNVLYDERELKICVSKDEVLKLLEGEDLQKIK